MNKKGFTLVEILGVITVIAIISVLVIPTVINQINSKKDEMDKVYVDTIYKAANLYFDNNRSLLVEKTEVYVKIETLVEQEYLEQSVFNYDGKTTITDTSAVKMILNNNKRSFEIVPNMPS